MWQLLQKTSKSTTIMVRTNDKNPQFKKIFAISDYIEGLPKIIEQDGIKFYLPSIENFKSVEYEKKVYSQINREIISSGECTYFVRSIEGINSKDLTYNEILSNVGKTNEQLLLHQLFISIYKVLDKTNSKRAEWLISQGKGIIGVIMDVLKIFRFSQITTEFIPNQLSLAYYTGGLLGQCINRRRSCSIRTYPDLAKVLFQVLVGCFSLGVHRIEANDLHDQNILVKTVPEHNTRCIIKSNKRTLLDITYKTKVKALLFDWDFAHSSKIGKNPKLDHPSFCKMVHDCNNLVDKVPISQRIRTSILRNMSVIIAWLSFCGRPDSELKSVFKDWSRFIIMVMAIDDTKKRNILNNLLNNTCISNIDATPGSTKYIRRKINKSDDPLGMGDKIKVGEYFLDPIIYAPGELFKDPIEILHLLGSLIASPTKLPNAKIEANIKI